MNTLPRLSVILPIYNCARYLDEALQSLANQSFTDFEVITIDDCSTDNSAEVVAAWEKKDNRIKLYRNTKNQGLPKTLNVGLGHVRGEFIARMDQDDISRPNRFAKQIAYLEQHPNIGLVGGGYQPFNEQGKRAPVNHPLRSTDIAWQFLTNTRFAHPTVMFRRTALEAVGQYPIQEAEDFGFFSKIVQKFPAANLPDVLLDYREHGGNMSTVRHTIIQRGVYDTFIRNYQYYVGSDRGQEEFYQFAVGRRLPLRKLIAVWRTSWRILQSIRRSYGLTVTDTNWMRTVASVILDIDRAVIRDLLGLRSLAPENLV